MDIVRCHLPSARWTRQQVRKKTIRGEPPHVRMRTCEPPLEAVTRFKGQAIGQAVDLPPAHRG